MAYGPTRAAAWPAHAARRARRTPWTGHRAQGGRAGMTGGSLPVAPVRRGRRHQHGGAKGVAPGKGMEDGAHYNCFATSGGGSDPSGGV
jgi:hypothetical protein